MTLALFMRLGATDVVRYSTCSAKRKEMFDIKHHVDMAFPIDKTMTINLPSRSPMHLGYGLGLPPRRPQQIA
jgi:hypothetical protein